MKKYTYLGIDQTGAVKKNGTPKPLPACYLRENKIYFFYLEEFSKKEINNKIMLRRSDSLLVAIDCVIGLPKSVKMTWAQALEKVSQSAGFGRTPAQLFFRQISKGTTPRREIEILCNANSVFQEKPFQKNIQTGTYRFWKEISQNRKDFYAPAIENQKNKSQLPIYEGYPSFAWKILFQVKKRSPENLKKLLSAYDSQLIWTQEHQALVEHDPNFADALVLALIIKRRQKYLKKIIQNPEGHILGL